MLPHEYQKLETDAQRVLDLCRPLLSGGAISDVLEKMQNAELEMAVESLGLSLLHEGVHIPEDAKPLIKRLCYDLKLNVETVFDSDFWNKILPQLQPEQ